MCYGFDVILMEIEYVVNEVIFLIVVDKDEVIYLVKLVKFVIFVWKCYILRLYN